MQKRFAIKHPEGETDKQSIHFGVENFPWFVFDSSRILVFATPWL